MKKREITPERKRLFGLTGLIMVMIGALIFIISNMFLLTGHSTTGNIMTTLGVVVGLGGSILLHAAKDKRKWKRKVRRKNEKNG